MGASPRCVRRLVGTDEKCVHICPSRGVIELHPVVKGSEIAQHGRLIVERENKHRLSMVDSHGEEEPGDVDVGVLCWTYVQWRSPLVNALNEGRERRARHVEVGDVGLVEARKRRAKCSSRL